jgi:hypothetical protein
MSTRSRPTTATTKENTMSASEKQLAAMTARIEAKARQAERVERREARGVIVDEIIEETRSASEQQAARLGYRSGRSPAGD